MCEGWKLKGFRLYSRILIALGIRLRMDFLQEVLFLFLFVFWVICHPYYKNRAISLCSFSYFLVVGFLQRSGSRLPYDLEGGMWAKFSLELW